MTRICVALGACMLLLGGCMRMTKAEFPTHYALNNPTPRVHKGRHATHPGAKILQIARITVPEWIQGTAMYYRLDYQHDSRVSAYGRSDWIAPPATLLEPVVQNAITAGGGWRAVIGPGNPATADASMHLRLNDFSQTFSQPDHSVGVLDATATLIDNHDDSVVAQKHFHIEVPAPTADAPGGAKALDQSSQKFAEGLQRWLETTATDARSKKSESN